MGFNGSEPRGSISRFLRPRMVSVRIAARLCIPIVLPGNENPINTRLPRIASERTSPTFTPAISTLSPVLMPPVSANCA
ncbi:Uncharacterised protein [Mycobacterium tuberculosis]|nr:Uncharacterised protein [Mycobacterium tuberculosis]